MADKDQPQQPTHRAYSVIKREGQDDYWLNLGLASRTRTGRASTSCSRLSLSTARSSAARSPTTSRTNNRRVRIATTANSAEAGKMPGPIRKAIVSYLAEIAQLPDGTYYVSLTATTVDDEEPQLLNQMTTTTATRTCAPQTTRAALSIRLP
jgi:hypothetical protein